MSFPATQLKLSVEDYLEGEKVSPVRHEYVGGTVYAMAGTSKEHNLICLNLASALHGHLRGKRCKVFMSDIKVKIWANHDVYYYPDLMVACGEDNRDRYAEHAPTVLVEVISESTRRIDEQEKLLTYPRIDALQEYVLVEQASLKVTVHRRVNDWAREELVEPGAVLDLQSIGFELPIVEIYDGVFAGL